MCILLYVKLIWCNGFPYIYVQLEEGDKCKGDSDSKLEGALLLLGGG